MVNPVSLKSSLGAELLQFRATVTNRIFAADMPVLGADFVERADQVLGFLRDVKIAIDAALDALDPATATVAEIAAALDSVDGISALVDFGGNILINLSEIGSMALDPVTLRPDLGLLPGGVDLSGMLDIDAITSVNLSWSVDASTGALVRTDTAGPEFSMSLSGGVNVNSNGDFGFLNVAITDNITTPELILNYALDVDGAGNVSASVDGGASLNISLLTSTDAAILPTIGADFIAEFQFDAATIEAGLAVAAETSLGIENVTLDLGALADFFDGVFGQLLSVTDTFPFGQIIDILTARLPVIDDIGPKKGNGGLDRDGDGFITLRDLAEIFSGGDANFAFVDAVVDILEIVNTIDDLRQLNDQVNLGSITFGADASTVLSVDGGLPVELPGAFGAAIEGALSGEFGTDTRLTFPFLENPLELLGGLLLNGFGTAPVTLVEYDLPELEFGVDIPINFNIGPVVVYITGGVSVSTDFGFGYDTSGFSTGGFDFIDGFYLSTEAAGGGEYAPFADISLRLAAGGGLSVLVGKVAVEGGITGTIGMELAGSDDGRSYLRELMFPCIFDSISGEVVAGLDVVFSVGVKPLQFSDRISIAETVLAQFDIDPCDHVGATSLELQSSGLATQLGSSLRLNTGSNAVFRNIPGAVDEGDDGNKRVNENFFVTTAPPDNEGVDRPGAYAVNAFGLYEVYGETSTLTVVQADGGSFDDSLGIESTLNLTARFDGGAGRDTLLGAALSDSLSGDGGQDRLFGFDGNDTLNGGDNDDVLAGGRGADVIDGGTGTDELDYSASDAGVTLTPLVSGGTFQLFLGKGGDGEGDVVSNVEYIRGSAFADTFLGNPFASNVLQGNDGNDFLEGGMQADLLIGGLGADTLRGGATDDPFDADDIVSYALSLAGVLIDLDRNITIGGEATGDAFFAIEHFQLTFQDDTFVGDTSANNVDGFDGNDVLDGRLGADTLIGGFGDDTLLGNLTGDLLDGGGAIFLGANGQFSGHGRDLLTYEFHAKNVGGATGVVVDLDAGTVARAAVPTTAVDVIAFALQYDEDGTSAAIAGKSSIEDVTATHLSDTLIGDIGANLLRGLAMNDSLSGGGADDTLIGGSGADTLNGGSGFDWADYSESSVGVNVSILSGNGVGGDAQGDVISGIENLIGSNFFDTLIGGVGNNIIDPGRLSSGIGSDVVDGGDGDDTLRIDTSDDDDAVYVDLSSGADGDIRLSEAGQAIVTLTSVEALDLSLGIGSDSIESRVFFANDAVRAGAGDDTLSLSGGTDFIYGEVGDDLILRNAPVEGIRGPRTNLSDVSEPAYFYLDGGEGMDTLSADFHWELRGLSFVSESPFTPTEGINEVLSTGATIANFEVFGTLATGSGSDTIVQLGRFNNSFFTNGGDDTIRPGLGVDYVDGGSGLTVARPDFDTLILNYAGLNTIVTSSFDVAGLTNGLDYQGRVTQLIEGRLGSPSIVMARTDYVNIEKIELTGGGLDDVLVGVAQAVGLTASGFGVAGDMLDGGAGSDLIQGLAGRDTLIGGGGRDTLEGGDGNDRLIGGVRGVSDESDSLIGGAGADEFVLADEQGLFYGDSVTASTFDMAYIADFDVVEGDVIVLSGVASDYTTQIGVNNIIIRHLPTSKSVAVIDGFTTFDLDASYVSYVPLAATSAPVTTLPDSAEHGDHVSFANESAFAGTSPFLIAPGNTEPFGLIFNTALDRINGVHRPGIAFDFDLEGSRLAYGTFENGVGLDTGLVLSTGLVGDILGTNTIDGTDQTVLPPVGNIPLNFTRIGTAGGSVVFRAEITGVFSDLTTLTIRDSGNGEGATGLFSGFDLDAVALSYDRLNTVNDGRDLLSSSTFTPLDVLDFSPFGVAFEPGNQREPNGLGAPIARNLAGSVNGFIDEGFVRLGSFDYDGNALNGGAMSLGDGGAIHFTLTQPVETGRPLYLYVAEAFDNGEELGGSVTVSSSDPGDLGDLSTDFGRTGADDDRTTVRATFNFDLNGAYDDGVMVDLFDLVIVTEELPEHAGGFNPDDISVRINGLEAAVLADGSNATLNRLATSPYGDFAEELRLNLVGEGAFVDVITADAYTTVLRIKGPIVDGENVIEFSVADARDGFLDTAIFLAPVGAEVISGTGEAEWLSGTALADEISGLAGADTIAPGLGYDFIMGGGGRDEYRGTLMELDGDRIDDFALGERFVVTDFVATSSSFSTRIEDDGSVTFVIDGPEIDDLYSLNVGSALGVPGPDFSYVVSATSGDTTVYVVDPSVVVWVGRPFRDTIFGGLSNDLIDGLAGSDSLVGRDGDDIILGGDGFDVLRGQNGDDTLDGGDDGDSLRGDNGNDLLFGGGGRDNILGGFGSDTLNGGEGDDFLRGEGDSDAVTDLSGNNRLFGDAGDDTLTAGDGNDTVSGGIGADLIDAGGGEDLIIGGNDGDTVFGGAGNDTVYADNGANYVEGGDGSDRLQSGRDNDTLIGGSGDDSLIGLTGADELHGEDGDDRIDAGGGDDLADGGAGDDFLRGGSGADTIIGGAGNDTMDGGGDDDEFVFSLFGGHDVIQEFERLGDDALKFVGLGFMFDTPGEVLAAATQVGRDVVISLGLFQSITIERFDLADLGADDILFG